jgi:Carboxypeptidase regulatory-like domain/Cupin domain
MTLALIATLHLLVAVSFQAPTTQKPAPVPAPTTQKPPQPGTTPKKPAASSTATTVATVTVTDASGAPIHEVHVTLSGGVVNRSGSTQPNGIVKFDGLRAGQYQLRFTKDGYVTAERELEWKPGQKPPALSVVLSPPSQPEPPPPPAPEPPKAAAGMPPPGKPVSVALPDFIEKNYIGNSQPQKVTPVGCSGLTQNLLWQIREPWEDRQHQAEDLTIYVIGGDGTLKIDGRDIAMQAGHFASVPRGSSYSLLRRGRNPLIVLATLVGEPCQ